MRIFKKKTSNLREIIHIQGKYQQKPTKKPGAWGAGLEE
jgi:hypothetical protein